MDILQKVKLARQKLNATQFNWQEECLFDCNDILQSIIAELESGLTPRTGDGAESVCPECGAKLNYCTECEKRVTPRQ